MLLKNYLVNIWCPTGRIFQLKKGRQGSIMEPLNLHQIQTCRLALCLIRSSICDLLTTVWLKWGQTKICKIRPKLPCESSKTFLPTWDLGAFLWRAAFLSPGAPSPTIQCSTSSAGALAWLYRMFFLPFPSQKLNRHRKVKVRLDDARTI